MPTLSEQQLKAVNTIDGQVLLISCPGSGKTTTIVNRAVKMAQAGIAPGSMLNITFTKAAAEEMKKRYDALCKIPVQFSTIHAFCFRLLCDRYGYNPELIFKESEKWMFCADRIRRMGFSPEEVEKTAGEAVSAISFIKNREIGPLDIELDTMTNDEFSSIYNGYEEHKNDIEKIDFDDMLLIFRDKLVDKSTGLLQYCRKHYKYITIDEFQDVNKIQADIFYSICGPTGNIFAVGDDDQSIYGFRAAQSQIMLDFPKQFPDCTVLQISTNYRSCKRIIKAAANLISHNKNRYRKEFLSSRTEAGVVRIITKEDSLTEAATVMHIISESVKNGGSYNNAAILFRVNKQATIFASKFIKKGIPFYTTERMPGLHEDMIFLDIKAYYRLSRGIEKKGDLQRILNHPSRFLKASAFKGCSFNKKQLLECAKKLPQDPEMYVIQLVDQINTLAKAKTPKKFMQVLKREMGYRNWLKGRAEYLGKQPQEFYQVFDALVDEANSFSSMEEWLAYAEQYEKKLKEAASKKEKEGICLSTFHGAKGLEWDDVYIVGANNGLCPYYKAETEDEIEEERRMFYVAMTRARNTLYICCNDGVKADGGKVVPSYFIDEAREPAE